MIAASFRTFALAVGCLLVAPWAHAEAAAEGDAEDVEKKDAEDVEKKDAEDVEKKDAEDEDDFGHGGQFGLRAALVAGYRMILRYEDSPYCREYDLAKAADDQATFCGHTAPLALDLGVSFAPLDFIEPYLWLRFGLAEEKETLTEPVVLVGAGARIYTMSDSAFKIYVEPAVGLEFEKGTRNDEGYDQDFIFHLAAGPQLDVAKNVGLFVDGGLTLGVRRSLHSALELKAGVQARLP